MVVPVIKISFLVFVGVNVPFSLTILMRCGAAQIVARRLANHGSAPQGGPLLSEEQ
jgi:hypothetical protein